MKHFLIVILAVCVQFIYAQQSNVAEFELDTRKKGAAVHSTMWGIFLEDINFSADGGLYAELVKNRSFDFPQNLMGWRTAGEVKVRNDNPLFPNNPNYLQLSAPDHDKRKTAIENEGFRGMGFKKDETYRFSVWAKKEVPADEQKLRVELVSSRNDVIGSGEVIIDSDTWKQCEVIINAKATDPQGRLRIFYIGNGSICIDHVSLFPTNTWKGRKNGLRKDLAQALYDLNPGVFRFPGGCIVEGTDLETRYDWKKSVGQVENRPLNQNRWNYTHSRFDFDYFQSYGAGFYEYFLLAEDMGAEPVPIVSVGLACQFENKDESAHVPVAELWPYVQDALDLVEFANGPVTSTWGKERAEMGHPEPFNLKFIGIGNEQWGKEYPERLEVFMKAFREKYPEIKLIGSSGPGPDGERFDFLWSEMRRLKVDLVDEHYYRPPQWFFESATRYDSYSRKGPAVFAGEYAAHDRDNGRENTYLSALSEAAFMTGLERNADIVHMCTYAPLFAHVDAWQWKPDLIWFDNLRVLKTPNYYVQQLYGHNAGTHVMPLTWNKKPITGQEGLFASAVYDGNEKCYIVKVVNSTAEAFNIQINLTGVKKGTVFTLGDCIKMQHNNLQAVNTLEQPSVIIPQKTTAQISGNAITINAEGQSFGIYKIKE